MNNLSYEAMKAIGEMRKKQYPAGTRVKLIHTNDPYTKLKPGVEGTVRLVDLFGTVQVSWDDGSNLGMIPEDGDRFQALD